MTWMLTYTGATFDLRHADPADISTLDIAHALSQLNRYTGHASRPYSVAEHSLLVVEIMQRDLCVHQPNVLLAGLMHDAHEAYTNDVATPMKQMLGEVWRVTEDNIQRQVLQRFGLAETYTRNHGLIKMADTIALATERRDLLPPTGPAWPVLRDVAPIEWLTLDAWDAMEWSDWRQAFIDKFSELHAALLELEAA